MASLGQLVSELVTKVANGRTDDIEKYLEIYNTKIEENKSGLGSIKKCSSRIKLLSSKTQRGRIRQECNILKCFPGTKCTFSILQGFITKTSNITLLQRNKYSFQGSIQRVPKSKKKMILAKLWLSRLLIFTWDSFHC